MSSKGSTLKSACDFFFQNDKLEATVRISASDIFLFLITFNYRSAEPAFAVGLQALNPWSDISLPDQLSR